MKRQAPTNKTILVEYLFCLGIVDLFKCIVDMSHIYECIVLELLCAHKMSSWTNVLVHKLARVSKFSMSFPSFLIYSTFSIL